MAISQKTIDMARLAADPRTNEHEARTTAVLACRRLLSEIDPVEDVPEARARKRVIAVIVEPLYLIGETEDDLVLVPWEQRFLVCGIPQSARVAVVRREDVVRVEWLTDQEKAKNLGGCPSAPITRVIEIARGVDPR